MIPGQVIYCPKCNACFDYHGSLKKETTEAYDKGECVLLSETCSNVSVTRVEKLDTKPKGPSKLVVVFECKCGNQHTVYEEYEDFNDCGDGDSLDFRCENDCYYKKLSRIFMYAKVIDKYYVQLPKSKHRDWSNPGVIATPNNHFKFK